MGKKFFNWARDCGSILSPLSAAKLCRKEGISFREYAERYAAERLSDDLHSNDLIQGMVREMESAISLSKKRKK